MMIFQTLLFNSTASILTSLERFEAMRRLSTNFAANKSFILTGILIVIVLFLLLLCINVLREIREKKTEQKIFLSYAQQSGLDKEESRFLYNLAGKTGLKYLDSVLAVGANVEQKDDMLVSGRSSEEAKQVKNRLSFIREKLSYQRQLNAEKTGLLQSRNLSTKQIPVERKLYINRRGRNLSDGIEVTVTENTETELVVKLPKPIKIVFGEMWTIQYHFGPAVWEFESAIMSYDGNMLVFNHTDNVRYINRRKFLRVPVHIPACISEFPFTRNDLQMPQEAKGADAQNKVSAVEFKLPQFAPAVVTELAGPGLRIETSLQLKQGQRVMVMFAVDEKLKEGSASQGNIKPQIKQIEDIGIVRHIKPIENSLSAAVELTGLSDTEINELVKTTNAVSVKNAAISDFENPENQPENNSETKLSQGV